MAKDNSGGDALKQPGKFLGSLREALAAASRDDTDRFATTAKATATVPAPDLANQPSDGSMVKDGGSDGQSRTSRHRPDSSGLPDRKPSDETSSVQTARDETPRKLTEAEVVGIKQSDENIAVPPPIPSAAEAARIARGGTPNIPPVGHQKDHHVEFDAPPTTRVVRQRAASIDQPEDTGDMARTQLVRGKQQVERGEFKQDPVVGWLVIVGGAGIGSFRPIFEGNNTVGRSAANRIAIDFGDESISADEQAYIRYDSADRTFLFVPNLAKTNVVSVNDKRPSSAVPLQGMDVITMGRTQIVFVPFCGPDFDWSELTELKS